MNENIQLKEVELRKIQWKNEMKMEEKKNEEKKNFLNLKENFIEEFEVEELNYLIEEISFISIQ